MARGCHLVLVLLLLVTTFGGRESAASDMFSSVAELEQLYLKEQHVARHLATFLTMAKKQVNLVETYMEELKELRQNAKLSSMADVIGNPINAFHLLRRMSVLWSDLRSVFVQQSNITNLVDEMMAESAGFPTQEDFSGAAFSLAQLQGAYRLNVSQLVRGEVQMTDGASVFPGARGLNAQDCLFIGKHAFNKGLYDQAVQWLQTAVEQSQLGGSAGLSAREIQPFLTTAVRVHDDVLEKKGPVGKNWRTNSEPLNPQRRERFLKRKNKRRQQLASSLLAQAGTPPHEELEIFHRLCRGERLRPLKVEARLKCRYVRHEEAYFQLRRLKLEEMSHQPHIVVFHEFMNEAEMELFKALASVRLERSAHGGKYGATTSDKRTSKQKWIEETQHPLVAKVSARISSAVRMTAKPYNVGAEFFQVANYGIGGRYTPHQDFGPVQVYGTSLMNPEDEIRGDRIATLMTYLEDVEAGGATVFTMAGVTIWPRKGSAAFWWNLNSDLTGDVETRHGGCPVLHGSKWICNKWFHSNEQMFRHRCDIKPKTRITFP